MEDALSGQLRALGPDRHARKANLLHLVSCLTSQEIRDLRHHLSTIDFLVDFIPKLPVELRVIVARYVDQEDIFNLLNVSKRWRAVWAQEDVVLELSRRFLPGFVEYFSLQKQHTSTSLDLGQSFYETARRFHYRTQGKYRRGFLWPRGPPLLDNTFAFDPIQHPPEPPKTSVEWFDIFRSTSFNIESFNVFMEDERHLAPISRLYSNGRVAWQPQSATQPQILVVDDLRTRLRKIYTASDHLAVMQGEMLVLVAIGDTLLVAMAGRKVYAWHLNTNHMERVTLPFGSVRHVRTHGNIVCFAGRQIEDFLMWTFGGGLQALDVSEIKQDLGNYRRPGKCFDNFINFLFHPVLKHALFIAVKRPYGFTVYEYINGGYSRSFRFDFDKMRDDSDYLLGNPIRETNAYGQNSIWTQLDPVPQREDQFQGLTVVFFNVLQTEFSVQTYPHLNHTRHWGIGSYIPFYWLSIWNGSLLAIYHNPHEPLERLQEQVEQRQEGIPERWASPLIATREKTNIRKVSSGEIPIDSHADMSRFRKADPCQMADHDYLSTRLEITREYEYLPPLASQEPALQFMLEFKTEYIEGQTVDVWEDDNFLVALFDRTYVVWEF